MKPKTLKIAFLLGSPDISGGTNVIFHHAAGLAQKGHEVWIFTEETFDKKRTAWHSQHKKLKFTTYATWDGGTFDIGIATWWRTAFNLPDIKAKQLMYFCQSIESRFFPPFDFDMKLLVRHTYRMPIPIITESSWIASYLKENFDRDCVVVPNGIEKNYFKPIGKQNTKKPFRVLVEGALGVRFKNTEKAIELCKKAGVEEIYLLTNTPFDAYDGITKVYSQVAHKDVHKVYQSCDVILKLSTVEGMFGPPLEMFHCGGTAIAYKVTGHEDYLVDGGNSLLAEINDDEKILSHLQRLGEDKALLEQLKQGAAQTAKSWPDWSSSIDQFETAIQGFKDHNPSQTEAINTSLRQVLSVSGGLHQIEGNPYNLKDGLNQFKNLLSSWVFGRPFLHEPNFILRIKGFENALKTIRNTKVKMATQDILSLIYEFQTQWVTFKDLIWRTTYLVKGLWSRYVYFKPKTIGARIKQESFIKALDSDKTKCFTKAWRKREIDICLVVCPNNKAFHWGEWLEAMPQQWSVFCLDPEEDRVFVHKVLSTSRVVVFLEDFEATKSCLHLAFESGCVVMHGNAPDHYWRLEWEEHFLPFKNQDDLERRLRQVLRSPDLFKIYQERPKEVLSNTRLFF